MLKGTTKSGFEWECSAKIRNDWRFIKAIAKANSNDGDERLEGTVDAITLLFGKDGEARLCEHLREEDGTVPMDKVTEEFLEIISSLPNS